MARARAMDEVEARKRTLMRRWFAGVLAVVCTGIGLLVGSFENPAWRIRKVVIYAPDPDMARELRAVDFGGPCSYVLCTADRISSIVCNASHRVASTAWVQKVRKDFSVHVLAIPRRPVAAMKATADARSYLLVDETGFVYAPAKRAPEEAVVMVAFPTPQLWVGHELPPRAREIFQSVMAGIRAGGAPVKKIDFSNISCVTAYLRDGTPVRIGYLANLERKFALVGYVLNAAAKRGDQVAFIDVSAPLQPYYLPKTAVAQTASDAAAGGTM